MTPSDLEVASDFLRRCAARRKPRRARLGKRIPVAAASVTAVVTDLVEMLASDHSADVRHKKGAALARFVGRDGRASEAIVHAAPHHADLAMGVVAPSVVDSDLPQFRGRKAALRDARRASRRASYARLRTPA
jgi:hypothetical protein